MLRHMPRSKKNMVIAATVLLALVAASFLFAVNAAHKKAIYPKTPRQVVDLFFQAAIAGDAKQMVSVSVDPCIESKRERLDYFSGDQFTADPLLSYQIVSSNPIDPSTEQYVIRFTSKSGPQIGDLPYRIILINNEWKLVFDRFAIDGIPNSPTYGSVSRINGCEARESAVDKIKDRIKSFLK
ncbi:hypothetical protein [Paenibacillus piri]|uniref:DUF4878 domain-containing protein n=1 Tax=Paenibacillus piri TaxID=2547395 RepID=A0A4R5KWF9_9BACL|nr:hypothetical protein [Paenibacillus piri]TDF99357.1 hypothetical protein E1757_05740 [Paenibacillus piri]